MRENNADNQDSVLREIEEAQLWLEDYQSTIASLKGHPWTTSEELETAKGMANYWADRLRSLEIERDQM